MMGNRSLPPGAVVPFLVYPDVARAIDWLCGAFGFRELLRTPPEPDGTIHHAQLAAGEGAIVLNGRPGHDFRAENGLTVLVRVDNVDAHCEHARTFGAKIIRHPRTAEFGERQYTARDVAGYEWTFSQTVADISPLDWGAILPGKTA